MTDSPESETHRRRGMPSTTLGIHLVPDGNLPRSCCWNVHESGGNNVGLISQRSHTTRFRMIC
ncbi:hypothetical protein M413DRAFT_319814 [Hebeloma cylindrosporum]|uniref:Uncharacterized protein n=1 Tax=Hebeloma cylindrosporum TaxID=76867 RepID=A0A0C2Y5F5_HEBCY|nr:hypothetical protein M413DRAFT_319814 [Hebeloma cylindrosporum h7]